MLNRQSGPRWWVLYLALPLAGLLMWLVERGHHSAAGRALLEIGVLVGVWVYVEVWYQASKVALLRHPLTGGERGPIYYAHEVTAAPAAESSSSYTAVLVTDSYSALFAAPTSVVSTPDVVES